MNSPASQVITVVGAGLAGCECAWQLAEAGFRVNLYEMKRLTRTPAQKSDDFAELVCSNSLGTEAEFSAPGQLKWEAQRLNSFLLKIAKQFQVPAGQSLSVDRREFGRAITEAIHQHPRITVIDQIVSSLKEIPRPAVIATGPLTHEGLAEDLRQHFGSDFLYFFDAISPILDADSINTEIAWKQDRYDKGTADYWNCPLNRNQYESLVSEILSARKIEPHDFEQTPYFEGCMPIEEIARRGLETLRFGPLKPVGLTNPRSAEKPYAVVQLRQENLEATAYNMVGFQTKMAYPEQTRVFRSIPGLENAEFLKLGSIHRNLYVQTPRSLRPNFSSIHDEDLFFAGQIIGVEGYFESTVMGLLVARVITERYAPVGRQGEAEASTFTFPPRATAIGSLVAALHDPERAKHFQPTNINLGLFPALPSSSLTTSGRKKLEKSEKKKLQIERARFEFQRWQQSPASPTTDAATSTSTFNDVAESDRQSAAHS